MRKYSSPTVRWDQVLDALPLLPPPFRLEFVIGPTGNDGKFIYTALELRVVLGPGASLCFKRWGRSVRAANEGGVPSGCLLAAQEAYAYVKGKDTQELLALACWELGVPIPE